MELELRAQSNGLAGSQFLSLATFGQALHLCPHSLAWTPSFLWKTPPWRLPHQQSQSKEVSRSPLHVVD